jgi:1-phosphofructokinase
MKVATITLNPAIDLTVQVDHFQPNSVNRAQAMHSNAGGKGVNVASFLADYGMAVAATGFVGVDNAEVFERLFTSKHIDDACIRIPGATRIGIKIVDEANQQTTDVNLPGLTPSPEALHSLRKTVEALAPSCDWFVLAGNLPPGVSPTIYAELITWLSQHGKQTVLDTSGPALRAGIEAHPTIIKPNVSELRELTRQALADESAIASTARDLIDAGIRVVVVSMGEDGALFCNDIETVVAVPPVVAVKSTVGAGDALVAGTVASLSRHLDLQATARLATGFAVGAITTIGANLPPAAVRDEYTQQVRLRTLAVPSRAAERSLPASD